MNPFQTAGASAGTTQVPVAGFAPAAYDPLAGIADAKMPGSSRPRLEEGHDYVVEVTDYVHNKQTFFIECTVVESTGGSPVGFKTSISQSTKSDFWEGYFKKLVLANMGVDANNALECAPALPYIRPCLTEALTKVANASLPIHLIGRKMGVTVTPGKPALPGKKYYPETSCFVY